MQINLKARDWHNWVSVLLILPVLLVGFTSIFLAHKKELGLNDIDLTPYVAWLPGYGESAKRGVAPEVRSLAWLEDGNALVGTKNGLYAIDPREATLVEALGGVDVRDIVPLSWGVIVATKEGVWLDRAGHWQRVLESDAWSANPADDGGVIVTTRDQGPLLSRDGLRWEAPAAILTRLDDLPLEQVPVERVTLGKLMVDLHTGRAFLGKRAEWIWIDLLGFVLVFLGFTGLWLWWRTQTKRRDSARKRVRHLDAGAHA